MNERPTEEVTPFPDNSPGKEWVLLRSGGVPAEIHKGELPKQWVTEETGHIFVRNEKTGKWHSYDREGKRFFIPPEQWQAYAANEWEKGSSPITKIQKTVRSRLAKTDIFDSENHVDWDKLFELLDQYSKKRAEIFPNGTEGMSEADIIDYIRKNYSLLLAGGANPLEFPELIDEELRPLCNTINKTTWGRSYDGCAGHHDDPSEEHINPYLRVLLDLNNPSANKFIIEAKKLAREWKREYKNVKINLNKEKVISSKRKPRIIYYQITLNTDSQNISTDFFNELNERTLSLS